MAVGRCQFRAGQKPGRPAQHRDFRPDHMARMALFAVNTGLLTRIYADCSGLGRFPFLRLASFSLGGSFRLQAIDVLGECEERAPTCAGESQARRRRPCRIRGTAMLGPSFVARRPNRGASHRGRFLLHRGTFLPRPPHALGLVHGPQTAEGESVRGSGTKPDPRVSCAGKGARCSVWAPAGPAPPGA